ncbi:repetitive organellar protein-like [Leguminivora glycinivorella]|uniref:repetitive organellar protein-like n=1 Tax=Leguminivora glycinivorella TaxID=1035111 RepID=UPI002010745E|nr:repetitive organellar protein-like [Leguminivora glycinivorella]
MEATCEYQVGDLAWARVGTYPFWPCIVTREPFSDTFVKKKLFGRVERSVIHVTFFGDNGRRGWIVDNMLRKYHGKTEFEACRSKFTPESKKKDPRFYAAHFVSEKKLPLWNVSVEEAETLMKEPKRLRIDALYDMLEKARAAKSTPSKRDKGGKLTRTDSDVSLSESLYDTLFSEDDGKQDDSRSKRARNKSLDVSEVVTACLDNMAAKSGIIQIQRQSHMDRWLQKAKSKTPEKIQPKLHVKLEREKRKDRSKKKKEGRRTHKARKNESLGSDTNLLPYQNEHDYSSVNFENHNINDSSNKNTDSASGLDSTLDTSTTVSDIGVTVKIESLSSSMEDFSQDDIITSIVNDDIVMTDSVSISKDDESINSETNAKDHSNNKIENNYEHNLGTSNKDNSKCVEIREELPLTNSDLTNALQPRRSKRKRQTFEGLNNSITENKAKEPKLDLQNQKPCEETTPIDVSSIKNEEIELLSANDFEKMEIVNDEPTVENIEKETLQDGSVELTASFPDRTEDPSEHLKNYVHNKDQCEQERLQNSDLTPEVHKTHTGPENCVDETVPTTNVKDISTVRRSRRSKEKQRTTQTKSHVKGNETVGSANLTVGHDATPIPVADNALLSTETIEIESNLSENNTADSTELIPCDNDMTKSVLDSVSVDNKDQCESSYQEQEALKHSELTSEVHKTTHTEPKKCVKETIQTTNDKDICSVRRSRRSKEKQKAKQTSHVKENQTVESTDLTVSHNSTPIPVVNDALPSSENTKIKSNLLIELVPQIEISENNSADSTEHMPRDSNITKSVIDNVHLNNSEHKKDEGESAYQEQEALKNSELTSEVHKTTHTEPGKCVKETIPTINDKGISTVRRSRRSKEKHKAMQTESRVKEKETVESTNITVGHDSTHDSTAVVDNALLSPENTEVESNLPMELVCNIEIPENNSTDSNEHMPCDSNITKSVIDGEHSIKADHNKDQCENSYPEQEALQNSELTSEVNKTRHIEPKKCVEETVPIVTYKDISTLRRSRRSKEKNETKQTKSHVIENETVESTDLTVGLDSTRVTVVDNVLLRVENTEIESNLPTELAFKIETSENNSADSTELISCDTTKSVIDLKPPDSENASRENNEPCSTNIETEISQNSKATSMKICGSKPEDGDNNKSLSSGITVTESDLSTVTLNDKEASQNRKLESTEPMPSNSKSEPVVVIEPLKFGNTICASNTSTVTNLEETCKNIKPISTELPLFDTKSQPVVVIEPLKCVNISTECNTPMITKLETETSHNNRLQSMELMAFHKSSKPVVVIEPLDMQGLETQFIIKGSKPMVTNRSLDGINKKGNYEDKSKTTNLSPDSAQNSVSNVLKDVNNGTEVGSTVDVMLHNVNTKPNTNVIFKTSEDVSKKAYQKTEISFNDCERMEVDTAPETKEIEAPKQSFVEKDDEVPKNNIQTNVVIGEETYVFDRTLSQDYDEIDGDCYDEYSHLPVIINEETEKAILIQSNLVGNEEKSCPMTFTNTSNNSTENISCVSNHSEPEIVKNDSEIEGNVQSDSKTVDHSVPTGDIKVQTKQMHNQLTV